MYNDAEYEIYRLEAEVERLRDALREIVDDSEGPLEFRYIRQIAREALGEGE